MVGRVQYRGWGILFLLCSAVRAEDPVDFERDVAPILELRCLHCHHEETRKGDLSLETPNDLLENGYLVPGDPDQSHLIAVITSQDGAKPEMPRSDVPLSDQEVAVIRRWIEQSAPWPADRVLQDKRRAGKSWWSLQPLGVVAPVPLDSAPPRWNDSPIDRLILASLQKQGLAPNSPADRRTLIRRVTYDLTGLPPTPEQVAAFCESTDPLAYERLVDRLLESPRYGEHWGRHWLDVVRFGESRGFERNQIIDDAWPFRDYVIRSFNEDKPFNQFIVEHLAGDVVAKGDPEREVGVAFLTIGPYDDVFNLDPVAQANIRAVTLDDMATATGAAFLGLTLNCARCHDHKFDPIPTEDYYRLIAAFEGVSHGSRPLVTPEQQHAYDAATRPLLDHIATLQSERDALEAAVIARPDPVDAPTSLRPAPRADLVEETFAPVQAAAVRMVMLANTYDPLSAEHARIDEFEVWTSGDSPRNVALASAGARAAGATGRDAEDFAGAYGIDLVNDGKYSERWWVGAPSELTITFAQPELVDRVLFSHDRMVSSETPVNGLGAAVIEYEILVSSDGTSWTRVADSSDRAPATEALARQRRLRALATSSETTRLSEIQFERDSLQRKLNSIPPLSTAWVGLFKQPESVTRVFRGGDPAKPEDVVQPASLHVLEHLPVHFSLPSDAPESERRLRLAEWIASDANALTARVLANRVWAYHFGVGIVDTPGDFGYLGSKPTHPELLDWLAARLHHHGWKLKPFHREIVLSQTYQQSGEFRDQPASLDRNARLLWRFPPRRLQAEEIRDTLLAVSGTLNLDMGGPGFRLYQLKEDNVSTYVPLDDPGPETFRRAVYHQWARASVVDLLSDFDFPDNTFSAPHRATTTSPLQALTLMNHLFPLRMAEALERQVASNPGLSPSERIQQVFQTALQRGPSEEELQQCIAVADEFGLVAVCRAILNCNELLYLE